MGESDNYNIVKKCLRCFNYMEFKSRDEFVHCKECGTKFVILNGRPRETRL